MHTSAMSLVKPNAPTNPDVVEALMCEESVCLLVRRPGSLRAGDACTVSSFTCEHDSITMPHVHRRWRLVASAPAQEQDGGAAQAQADDRLQQGERTEVSPCC